MSNLLEAIASVKATHKTGGALQKTINENIISEIIEQVAVPGDGADPTSALNHDATQHVAMRQHQEAHEHLRTAMDALEKAHRAIGNTKALHDEHLEHLRDAFYKVGSVIPSLDHAVEILGRANKSALK